VTRPSLPISSRSVDRVIFIFKSAWNFLRANRNSCYCASAIGAASLIARLEIPRWPRPAQAHCGRRPGSSSAAGSTRRCRKGRAFLERDGDGAWDRARALNSTGTAASRTSHFRLDRRRVSEGRPARLFGEGGEGKPMRNFPACKPLKYHKTAKYSGADAVMRKPPAGSQR
jgi:hypothetical protein